MADNAEGWRCSLTHGTPTVLLPRKSGKAHVVAPFSLVGRDRSCGKKKQVVISVTAFSWKKAWFSSSRTWSDY
ncbi:uncharacterized protein PHALS_10231 [Plasmopara halstedii]|uniref:Uncharacterized protein n=1 Tax=Plasmopara halstedii TaxID=4781 RepID=A0A0P1AH43_PLAHL|nr:uncharacterized protein PHALS_10231 [Plasmopara halstedii]CEG40008.1 hypothetical protein PHALS_10231 [Plasmopara halstedii]|eukprot:XP_024576377.1 hypothetical protein PHALS_10231 [Plasmopara halstedii]